MYQSTTSSMQNLILQFDSPLQSFTSSDTHPKSGTVSAASFSSSLLRHSRSFAVKSQGARTAFSATSRVSGGRRVLAGDAENHALLLVPNGVTDLNLLSLSLVIAPIISSIAIGDKGGEDPSDRGDMAGGAKVDFGDSDSRVTVPPLPGDVGLVDRMMRSSSWECAKKHTRRRQALPSLHGCVR